LGYRKAPKGGVWLAKLVKSRLLRRETTLGPADDALDPDGVHILSFAQAQRKAFEWKAQTEAGIEGPQKPITVREAIEQYEADLSARDGDIENIGRLRARVSPDLLDKPVIALTGRELRKWRDELLIATPKSRRKTPVSEPVPDAAERKLSPATVNRTCTVFKAALNLVAADPEYRIRTRQPWEYGLQAISNAEQARNVVLSDTMVLRVIKEAYHQSPEFGLLVHVAAATGARYGQIAALKVVDLQADRVEPRLMMPPSRKGKKGVPKGPHYPVPIDDELAKQLLTHAVGRAPGAPLLTKPIIGRWRGGEWQESDQNRPFKELVERCGLSDWQSLGYPAKVTMYALRHSSIVRQIKRNVPIRVVAVNHDTSVEKIESNYSHFLSDHTDGITRGALLKVPRAVASDNVVPMPERAAS